MMAASELHVEVRMAWWLMPYIRTVTFLAVMFGIEPNWQRVNYWIRRAISVRVGFR
jgi:hypothetical protein